MEALSKPELLSLLGAARQESERDWLMILVGYWHGLRVSEIIGIKGGSVRDGFLTVDRLKGSLRTTQALVSHRKSLLSERRALIDFARKTYPNQRLFPISRQHFWRLVRHYGKLAGIPEHKAHPHVLKHSIAMQMIDKAGIHKTRRRLGHKSISSTGAYLVETDANVDAAVVGAVGL
jgi:site-specific recombinase XerD